MDAAKAAKERPQADELDAARLGKGLQEYLSDRWVDKPQSIDQFGDQHGNYMFQLIVDALEARGLVAPDIDSPLLEQMRDEFVYLAQERGLALRVAPTAAVMRSV